MSDEAILDGFRHLEAHMTELFERTGLRFDSIEHRLDGVERRLDRLEVKVIDLEDIMRKGFAQLDDRLKTVESKIQK